MVPRREALPTSEPVVDVAAPSLPHGYSRGGRRIGSRRRRWQRVEQRAAIDRSAERRRRSSSRRGRDPHQERQPIGVVVATDYLTGDLAARSRRMTQGLRGLQPAARAQATAHRRLSLVLRDGDAADSVRRDVDGVRTWPSGSPGRCRCSRPRPARSAPAVTISASSTRAATSSARWSRRSTRWRRAGREPPPAGARARSSSSASTRSRRPPPLHRNDSRAHRDRRGVDRSAGRDHAPSTPRRCGCSSLDAQIVGQPAVAVFDRARPAAARRVLDQAARARADRSRRKSPCRERAGAARRRRSRPRWPARTAPRRHRPRARRRDAAHSRAEGRGLARGRAPAGARDQESADADPALGRAPAAEFLGAPPPTQGARRGVHDDDRRRGGIAEGPGRRVLAVRAHAGAAHRADRPASAASPTRSRSTTASSPTSASSSRFGRVVPQVRLDPEQIRRVIINLVDNAIEAIERHGHIVIETAARRRQQPGADRRGRRRPGHSGRRAREAVPAVLLDQAPRQRPRPRDRPAHRRRARRQHRGR